MKRKTVIIVATATAILLLMTNKAKAFSKPTASGKIRACDASGCGTFGASRTHGTHEGEDYIAEPNESIFSPISGKVIRFPFPYASDQRYTGILIQNENYSVKIFYMKASVNAGEIVQAGQVIGTAQNIAAKYSSPMTNHIHVEMRNKANTLVKPSTLL